jgi:uncharacterized protein YdhG (YjbR/CyaY superfamily)
MAMEKYASVDAYLQDIEPPKRAELERIRRLVKKLVPKAEEVISYGIPTFKYKGTYLIYFASFTNHMSVFPGAPLDLKEKLEGYTLGKGTIQFTAEKPLPDAIITELVMRRLDNIEAKKKNY